MKEAHLTLRLPAELARALVRRARALGVPKSHMVREAVASYLEPSGGGSAELRHVSARDLAARWRWLPRLTPAEAEALGANVTASRNKLPAPRDPWE